MKRHKTWRVWCVVGIVLLAAVGSGYGIDLLHEFLGGGDDGEVPFGSLIESGGTLYGMTQGGGDSGLGVVFSIGPDGTGSGEPGRLPGLLRLRAKARLRRPGPDEERRFHRRPRREQRARRAAARRAILVFASFAIFCEFSRLRGVHSPNRLIVNSITRRQAAPAARFMCSLAAWDWPTRPGPMVSVSMPAPA